MSEFLGHTPLIGKGLSRPDRGIAQMFNFTALRTANDNLREVASGASYCPEMGERAAEDACFDARMSFNGAYYFVSPRANSTVDFLEWCCRDAKVAYRVEDDGRVCMTRKGFARFEEVHGALITSREHLD